MRSVLLLMALSCIDAHRAEAQNLAIMVRLPSSDPDPNAGTISEAKSRSVLRSRDEALRDLEAAERDNDPARVAEARARVREAQAMINRYGLES